MKDSKNDSQKDTREITDSRAKFAITREEIDKMVDPKNKSLAYTLEIEESMVDLREGIEDDDYETVAEQIELCRSILDSLEENNGRG